MVFLDSIGQKFIIFLSISFRWAAFCTTVNLIFFSVSLHKPCRDVIGIFFCHVKPLTKMEHNLLNNLLKQMPVLVLRTSQHLLLPTFFQLASAINIIISNEVTKWFLYFPFLNFELNDEKLSLNLCLAFNIKLFQVKCDQMWTINLYIWGKILSRLLYVKHFELFRGLC